MLLRCFFGGPHKLSGRKVMPNGLGLIARQRFEFKLRLNGRDIPFRVPRRSIRCRPLDSARAAAVGRNLFQARFGRASADEAMMGRILAGLWAVVARICDFLPRRNTEATQQLTAAKHLRKRAGSNLVLNRSRSYLEPMLLECCNVNTFRLLQPCEGQEDS